MSTANVSCVRSRRKSQSFLGYKVAVAVVIFLAAVLVFGESSGTPDFTLAVSHVSIRVARMAQGSAIITTAITHDFDSSVSLTAEGLPTGTTAGFSRSTISSPGVGSSALTIAVGSGTPLGTYLVTVTARAGSNSKTATISLTVAPSQALPTGYGWHQLANTNMTSVCLGNLPNGMYSDPTMTTTTNYNFSCNQILPWGGAAADDTHQRLIVWGGGHSDYAGDEVSVLNLGGTPSWQAFTSPTVPVPYVKDGKNWEGLQPYFVGAANGGIYQPGASPSSRHTYNGLQYVPYQNILYSFGGGTSNGGAFSKETWTLDMGTATWTLLGPPYSLSPLFPTTAYNPGTGHIVMHDKSWSLLDFDPNTDNWTTLTSNYHISDGTTAAVDPVNNLFVVVGGQSTDGTGYPSVPTSQTVQVFLLTPPYTMLTWSDPSCDLIYRNGGLAWDGALGLMVGYPGGGNQVYLLNTGAQDVVTPFGTVPSHKCLDVPISLNPAPVKGVDYPQDGESGNWGIFGRFAYLPSLDTFVMMNDRTKNAWTMQLTGGSGAPNFALATSPGTLVVPEGSQGTSVISTTVSNGFNNAVVLSSAGVPVGTTVTFVPNTIAAPGAGNSTMTVNVGATTAVGTYPITVSAYGGGDTLNPTVTLTVTPAGQANFTISAGPASLNIAQGNQGASAITTAISGGFNSAISLSASGMPSGTTVTFNPQTIPGPGSGASTMTIAVGSSTPTGSYPITVTGNGGGVQQSTTVTLTVTVQQQPNFTISASPASLNVQQGNQGPSTMSTTIIGGFNGSISLSASGMPSGTTVSFNPPTIAAPGAGTSNMTITVGSSTPPGSYPITVTGSGGGIQQNATVTLTVTPLSGQQSFGFDFRNTAGFVTDPPGDNYVSNTTAYPTKGSGVTYGWVKTSLVQARDRNAKLDPRLAGINFATNGSPATFYADLPSAGTYNLSLAMGDGGYGQCSTQCQIQFLDGTTILATVAKGPTNLGYFYDAKGNNWSAAAWPTSNLSQQVTLAGTRLTVVVGTNKASGDVTPIAFLGVAQPSGSPNFGISAIPTSLSVQQGNQGTSTITTVIGGGFSSSISLSASGAPSGTTVSFNPQTIPPPGSGNSTVTFTVGAGTPAGNYPITVTGNGGGINQYTTITLTVTADFTLSASPASLSIAQGNQGIATITSAIGGGFSGAVSLSASGMPSGATVSFNPQTIPAPGSGNSTMAITVGASTPVGTYPITVTGNGGGSQQNTTVTLTVTVPPNFTISASPATLSVAQGNQGTSTITAAISGGFNGAIGLSASGMPSGTTVSFNPQTISAPGSGNSTMNITVGSSTPMGSYPITVTGSSGSIQQTTTVTLTVSGPSNFTLSASPASLSVAEGNQATSTITTAISGGFNSSISLSASGMPSGTTVSLNPQTIPAPGIGNALMTITVGSGTPTGSYPITVTGNGGGIQQKTTVTLTVTAGGQPNFTISASPAALSILQGNQGVSTITTTISGGFNSAISLSGSGAPSGTTVSFNPATIPAPGSGNSTITITVGSSTPTGTYPITVTGSGGGIQQKTTVTLTVTAQQQPTFTISALPASLSVAQGNQGTSTITTAISGGFNSSISLSSSGAPSGTTVSFNPASIPAPGTGNSTMTITVGNSTPTGTYPITVTGNGGGVQQNATVSLTVTSSGGGGGGNGIIVTSTSGSAQTNRMVSIGRFFKQADIPHFAQAVVGGAAILTQCDVKNRWGDGSLKFAIVSFVVPSVAASGTAVSFQDQSTGNNTGYLAASDMLGAPYNFDAKMNLTGTASPSISARTMLSNGSTNCATGVNCRYWLQGPIVTAVIIEDRAGRSFDVNTDGGSGSPLHPIFEAWFYPGAGCTSSGGCVEIGFTLENTWSSSTLANSAREQTFVLSLQTGNSPTVTQLTQPSFTQLDFTRWRRAYWIDTAPPTININYNWSYLATTGAYPNFDPQYVTATQLTNMYSVHTNETTGANAGRLTIPGIDNIGGNGGIVDYNEALETTGYSPWIGLYPQWDVDWLVSSDDRMAQMSRDNADLGGRFPIYFREADHNAGTGHYFDNTGNSGPPNYTATGGSIDTYGHVVSANARQQVKLNMHDWAEFCQGAGADTVSITYPAPSNNQFYNGIGGTNHLPDFGFIPYSLTGREYYLETEMYEANWTFMEGTGCFSNSVGYNRQGHMGMTYSTGYNEAWALRTMAYGAFIAPDGWPEGSYFASKLQNNIAKLEGEKGLPNTISGADAAWSWNWSDSGVFQFSQALDPSPLHMWRVGDCAGSTTSCYAYNGQEVVTGASWSNGTATLTVHNQWGWTTGTIMAIWGVNPSGYNQLATVTLSSATPTTISYPLASNPGAWVSGGTASGSANNINPAVAQAATSTFMTSFVDMTLGMVKQLGVADTTSLLTWTAHRPLNILLNPAVNHYLIDAYAYPTALVGPPTCRNPITANGCPWISDWTTWQTGFVALPSAWSSRGVDYGAQAAGALSFLSNIAVDGYNGLTAYNFFLASDTNLATVFASEPQWAIRPFSTVMLPSGSGGRPTGPGKGTDAGSGTKSGGGTQ